MPLDYPVNVLVSYHYYRTADIAEMASWGLRIIGDSGAYSADSQGAVIDRDDFYAWADRWRAALCWTASLDVIGDPDKSWANFITAPPSLNLIPTIHYGCDPRELDRYVEAGADFIGLGGMVGFKSESDRLLRWCLSVMRYAAKTHPQVRFHGWGVTHSKLTMNLPWYSVDSSGFSAAYRFGRLSLFDPDAKKTRNVALNGTDIADVDIARLLRKHYSIGWERIKDSGSHNRRDVTRVAMRSVQLNERYLGSRHRVSPPSSIVDQKAGSNVHMALGFPNAQPARALDPTDQGTKIWGAMASLPLINDLGRSKA